MEFMEVFARRLREEREAKGLKQSDLGKLIGVSSQTISSYERGRSGATGKMPTLDKVIAIADVLGLPLDYLCGRKEAFGEVRPTNYADLIKQIMALVEPFKYTAKSAIIQLPEEEQYEDPDNPDVWISKGTAAVITIQDWGLAHFFEKLGKMRELKEDGTINEDLYQSWLRGELEMMKAMPYLNYPFGSMS